MEEHKPLYAEQGYIYQDGKIAGKRSMLQFWPQELHVYGGSIAEQIGRQFGVAGALAGSAVDKIVQGNQDAKGPSMVVPYIEIATLQIHKSLLNGKGIMVTLKDGTKFKMSTVQMAYVFKKLYPNLVQIMKTANPAIVADEL